MTHLSPPVAASPLAVVDDGRGVQRHLVHRRSIAEVFLTGHRRGARGIELSAQWPRSNRFHLSADGRHYDELLAFETFRQACIYLGHCAFDVPADRRFVMRSAELRFEVGSAVVGSAPGDVRLALTWSAEGRHRFTVDALISCDGRPTARGRGALLVLDPRAYARLRAGRRATASQPPPSDITPQQVGRHFPADVLVRRTSAADAFLLRVDTDHPVHFDHPHDHVPGMLLIDAARQVVRLAHPQGPTRSIRVDFDRYVELDDACVLSTAAWARGQETTVTTTFVQGGHTKARAVVVSRAAGSRLDAAG